MKKRFARTVGALAALAVLGGLCQATTITFYGTTNATIPTNYGSYIAGNTPGFVTTDGTGATPNVALTWAPTPAYWEFHNSNTFADNGFEVAVGQMDCDVEGPDPTIFFDVVPGYTIEFHSLDIGNAVDQPDTEDPYSWTISIIRATDGATVFSHTTAPLDKTPYIETVDFSYMGDPGVDYTILFDDGGADRVRSAIDNLSFSEHINPGVAGFELAVDRATGNMTLRNIGTVGGSILAYAIRSGIGALDPESWLSIANNYDAGSPGPNQIDANNHWIILSKLDSQTDLSESELEGGDGASIAASASVNLGSGVWIQNPYEDYEDLWMDILLPSGKVQKVPVVFEGNGGQPFEIGDFNFDGDISAADWLIHNAGRGTDLTGLSSAQCYHRGDIDGSGTVDVVDFVLFKELYEEANGAGSFAALIGVPEPSTMALFLAGTLFLGISFSWRRNVKTNSHRVLGVLVLLSGFAGTSYADLQVYLPLDGSLEDVAGGHTVTLIDGVAGSTSYVPGTLGKAFQFVNPVSTSAGIDYVGIDYTLTDEGAIALWHTSASLYNYQSIVANSVQADDWEMWVYSDGRARARIEGDGPVTKPGVIAGQTYHIAWTWDRNDSDPSKATVNLYFDGEFVESATGSWVNPGDTVFIAGGSGNHGGNAIFDDFRIYDHTLSAAEVAELSQMTAIPLSLRINRNNGEIFLENSSGDNMAIDTYEITSASNSLDPFGWNSLEEQDYEGNGDPGTGNGWEVAGGIGTHQLIESYLLGNSEFADGSSVSLGNAFDFDHAGVQEDLVFSYHIAGTAALMVTGTVEYYDGGADDADFDGDGDVDGADFLAWQKGFGMASGATPADGDANADGSVNAADLAVWKSQFGTGGAASQGLAGTAVPEPGTLGLLLLAAVGLGLGGCRRCRPNKMARIFVLFSVVIVAMGQVASATTTVDRLYQFGEYSDEYPSEGGSIYSTYDSQVIDTISYYDQQILDDMMGYTTYTNVGTSGLKRPGVGTSTAWGAKFNGVDAYLSGTPLNRPDETVGPTKTGAGPLLYDMPFNYDGITARGLQMWVYPDQAGLNAGKRQTVVMDTVAMGGVAITAGGLWTQINDGHMNDTDIAATVEVVGNTWHHVMQHVYHSTDPGAPKVLDGSGSSDLGFTGVVYVNGIAVSANNDTPNPNDLKTGSRTGLLTVGAEEVTLSTFTSYFHGVVDDLEMYVYGDNSSQTGPPAGQNYGTFDLFTDNDWIVNKIGTSVPGGVLVPGDVNRDGAVNNGDVTAFVTGWLSEKRLEGAHNDTTVGDWETWSWGDMDHDGIVYLADAFILHQALLAAGQGGLDFSLLNGGAVPEPSSLVLVVVGVAFIAGIRRCVKK